MENFRQNLTKPSNVELNAEMIEEIEFENQEMTFSVLNREIKMNFASERDDSEQECLTTAKRMCGRQLIARGLPTQQLVTYAYL